MPALSSSPVAVSRSFLTTSGIVGPAEAGAGVVAGAGSGAGFGFGLGLAFLGRALSDLTVVVTTWVTTAVVVDAFVLVVLAAFFVVVPHAVRPSTAIPAATIWWVLAVMPCPFRLPVTSTP